MVVAPILLLMMRNRCCRSRIYLVWQSSKMVAAVPSPVAPVVPLPLRNPLLW